MVNNCHTVLSGYCSLVVTCWERTDLLDLLYVMFSGVFVPFDMVSWVRCGTWLYRFLMFAFFLTLIVVRTTAYLDAIKEIYGKHLQV